MKKIFFLQKKTVNKNNKINKCRKNNKHQHLNFALR